MVQREQGVAVMPQIRAHTDTLALTSHHHYPKAWMGGQAWMGTDGRARACAG